MAAQMEAIDKSRPFQVRDWGDGDDAWKTVKANGVFASHRPEKSVVDPNKSIWFDFVTVDLEDGTQLLFNHDDQVEVRSAP